jgi:bacillithiol system protein YtxJ
MIRPVTEAGGLEAAAAADVAVLYKHSPRCGASRTAQAEVRRFADAHPEVLVFELDVVAHRPMAREAAERFGVRHASPQVIVLRRGRVVWDGSQWEVEAGAIEAQVRADAPA